MTLSNQAKSHIRTAVPIGVGLIITLGLRAGVDLHGYAPEITAAVSYCFYTAARLAEEYISPRFGWLLGVATKPTYAPVKTT